MRTHWINLLFTCVLQETTALQSDIFKKRKRHINENNVAKEGLILKWRRQKTKSTYFANNQWLWIKFNFDSQKINDLLGSEGIQQKQPSSGILRKRFAETMQQIYRRTPISKCEFNKLHFRMGALMYVKFAACIFSEHIFLRNPLDGCSLHRLFCTLSSCINPNSLVNWHVTETKWETKDFLEKGGRSRNKMSYYILSWTNRITSGP